MIIREMTLTECHDLLASQRLGRLACNSGGRPYVVPIHFSLSGNYLYSFTMPGKKVEGMRENPLVCLQVDTFDEKGWRSVIVNGRYEELPDEIGHKVQRDRAWRLLSQHAGWWEPGSLKPVPQAQGSAARHIFYRIEIEEMTGRQAIDN
jgi:nitroimidazol reductase NimA-like FMN-containing flavoprotein (pyridoxamine 5'-phosphate oxidase superfamily)